ncbi:MAG: hypothetical protein BWY31_03107 [Lentisphaerae bacterium ADurb.Bin242]|nr:MAG: hypothetical protein BWY31_03107 [Lentisphaerae bacterium ADurb.Bin242]
MSKETCDYVVVGGGAAGMTLALLLAKSGARVVLVEKGFRVGGSMQRFHSRGIPFDTGFHFTTGLSGCFGDMFEMLDMRDAIREVVIGKNVYLADRDKMFHIPHGHANMMEYYSERFPAEAGKIREFFRKESEIYWKTPLFNIREGAGFTDTLLTDDDFIGLSEYMRKESFSEELKMLLASFAICCCGTPATEMSLATHCRISYGLDDRLVRFVGGGDEIVRNFLKQAKELGIQIRTNCTVAECLDIGKKRCHRIRLSDGTVLEFKDCIMTMHPREIEKTLPPEGKSRDFTDRVNEFEESCGFFTVFGVIEPKREVFKQQLTSYLTHTDLDRLMSPDHPDVTAAGIMLAEETGLDGKTYQTVTAFENVYEKETERWKDTVHATRPAEYAEYKKAKTEDLFRKICKVQPELEGRVRILDSASMLTYRDYLSPYGSAYGIRQKLGQQNLFGRLPIRNFYIIGQNALLPGAMGAMLSAFIVWRKLVGEEHYHATMKKHLKPERSRVS